MRTSGHIKKKLTYCKGAKSIYKIIIIYFIDDIVCVQYFREIGVTGSLDFFRTLACDGPGSVDYHSKILVIFVSNTIMNSTFCKGK